MLRTTVLAAGLAALASPAIADIMVIPDHKEWLKFAGFTQPVPTSAGGLTQAVEIALPPERGAAIGGQLSFADCLPELARFSVSTVDPKATFVFGALGAPGDAFADSIAVGAGGEADELLVFEFPGTIDGSWPIFAFAFTVRDNVAEAGESISLFGVGDVLLGVVPLPDCPGASAFVGLVSDDPIVRIHVEESSPVDDIAVGDFEIGSQPLPEIHYGLPQLQWELHVGSWETLHTEAGFLAQAEELGGVPPQGDAPLGPTLTFAKGAPLSRPFRLSTLEPGASWVLDDALKGDVGKGFVNALSVGERGVHTQDGWKLEILGGPPVEGIGFLLGDSDSGDGECLEVFGVNGTHFDTISPMVSSPGGHAFVSIHAHDKTESIGWIVFHELADVDDISISEIRLAPAGGGGGCGGDADHDGDVDGADLGALLAAWGPCLGDCHHQDLNDDGVVDGVDLGVLLSEFGDCG